MSVAMPMPNERVRAIERVMPNTCVRIDGAPGGEGTFWVESASHPGQRWQVIYVPGTDHWCPCPGFTHRGRCRHVKAVADTVWAEQLRTSAARTPAEHERLDARLREIEELFQ